jgi:glycosyltransferase involved in cell wall biosynthesis
MSKPTLLFRGAVKTRSGYGAHSRDLLEALYQMDMFEIKIDSCMWGNTPMTALDNNNEFHKWIENNVVVNFNGLPDFYVQVTIPSEFQRFGKFNIGITAGIETTVAPREWIDGCNRMDMVIATSNFSRDVLISTMYDEIDKQTNLLIKKHKVDKKIHVLFEGADTSIYNNKISKDFNLDIKEDFAYLFVGHWLKGNLGQDRKDIGMLIRCFAETFKNETNQPALILKTSSANFSVKERESFRKKIKNIVSDIQSPPPVYLLFGELTDNEMNDLYNHPKVKVMVSFTKGEGFGRPLLEFTMTGKPVIASNWSGHKDFLSITDSILLGGNLTDVDESAIDSFIIKGSKWFTVDYNQACQTLKVVRENYDGFVIKSESLRKINSENFTLEKMKDEFKKILTPHINIPKPPSTYNELILPKINKTN